MASRTTDTLHPNPIDESATISGTNVATQGAAQFERGTLAKHGRPAAAFIAHLIAANENVPQLRTLRRNDPGAASAVYDQAVGRARKDTLFTQWRSSTSRTA